ncbi:MAG: methyltransferase domain-containing protein [Oscillospiraceae bacterium]|nr:methyltransferase domain-containing protein [Oscillospiraceae bacterium]
MDSLFSCPVCGQPLSNEQILLRCPAGHSFDFSKYHYVNLFLSNQSSDKRHGDDRTMVLARKAFLDAGYYEPLQKAVCGTLASVLPGKGKLLDVGCGEGYYTAAMARTLPSLEVAGVDLSRDALRQAAKREPRLQLAVASAARLPAADGSFDALTCLFAPLEPAEYARVLRPGGFFLRAVVLEDHLMGLKEAVYDRPVPNPAPEDAIPGFSLLSGQDLRYSLSLTDPEAIRSLFRMTPYYYKTGRADQEKLDHLKTLETRIAFRILLYEVSS